jgi:hypothetical protein
MMLTLLTQVLSGSLWYKFIMHYVEKQDESADESNHELYFKIKSEEKVGS